MDKIKVVGFDFDGVFTNDAVLVDRNGLEYVRCSRKDGMGLARLRGLGIHMAIVSSETDLVVSKRAEKLKIKCFQGVSDKLKVFGDFLDVCGETWDTAAFLGNDINDLEVLEKVFLAIAVADADENVLKKADLVLQKNGGAGVVRELCDKIWLSHQQSK